MTNRNAPRPAAILLAGPTASGKSRLAADLARQHGAVIVNADSMQVYAELRILTARPGPEEEAALPHRLYGHVPAAIRYSVGGWLTEVAEVLREVSAEDRLPILVGGTGLYFRALTMGLTEVPPIPPEVRQHWQAIAKDLSAPDLHRLLGERSPAEAARLRPTDRSRILRALEVLEATGRTLADWQAMPGRPLIDAASADLRVLEPERGELYRRIDARLDAMIAAGALAEAAAIAGLGLDPTLPAMKAIGLPPLLAHLEGRISLDEAVARAKTDTRHYAKRQLTWLRHQMPGWERIPG